MAASLTAPEVIWKRISVLQPAIYMSMYRPLLRPFPHREPETV